MALRSQALAGAPGGHRKKGYGEGAGKERCAGPPGEAVNGRQAWGTLREEGDVDRALGVMEVE